MRFFVVHPLKATATSNIIIEFGHSLIDNLIKSIYIFLILLFPSLRCLIKYGFDGCKNEEIFFSSLGLLIEI